MLPRLLRYFLFVLSASTAAAVIDYEHLCEVPNGGWAQPLVEGPDGYFYGVGADAVFRVRRDGQQLEEIQTPADLNPRRFVFGPDGNLYGGADRSIVRMRPNGQFEALRAIPIPPAE